MVPLTWRRMKGQVARGARVVIPEQISELFHFNRRWFYIILLAVFYYAVLLVIIHNRPYNHSEHKSWESKDSWLDMPDDAWDEGHKAFVGEFQTVLNHQIADEIHALAKSASEASTDKANQRKLKGKKESESHEEEEEKSKRQKKSRTNEDESSNRINEDESSSDESGKKDLRYNVKSSPWLYHSTNSAPTVQKSVKYVANYHEDKTGNNRFSSCPYDKCDFTEDFSAADAVVFYGWQLSRFPINKFWKRPPRQRWIYKTVDPVISGFGLDNATIKSLFNWTSSYKIDSDIPSYMGLLSRKPNFVPKDYSKIWSKKTKEVAWFVSHCVTWSRREEYAERMAAIAPVDIFGRCGPLECGQNHGRMKYDIPECFPILSNDYKFYLSFENSFCHDYVTEKFFKVFLDVQIIPVVRGGVDYNNAFPKGTFVNADDFDTPEALMKYLVRLGNDEEAYTKMLAEKDKWAWVSLPEMSFFCKLCEKLHTDTSVGHYKDISKALSTEEDECWPPQDLGNKYKALTMEQIVEESYNAHHLVT